MSDADATGQRTVRMRKVKTDGRGRSVWTDTIETLELELVSTQSLKALLASDNLKQRELIQQAASNGSDGYLVRDNATGHFQIIDDAALQRLLEQQHDSAPAVRPPADVTLEPVKPSASDDELELSLVSTQALRKILSTGPKRPNETNAPKAPKAPEPDERYDAGGGFDPYNKR